MIDVSQPSTHSLVLKPLRIALLAGAAVSAMLLLRTVLWSGWWGHTGSPAANEFADLPTTARYVWILVPLAGVLLLVHPMQRVLERIGVPWRSLALMCVLAFTFVASLLIAALYTHFPQGLFVAVAAIGCGGYLLAALRPQRLRGVPSASTLEGRYARWVPRLGMCAVFGLFFGPVTQYPDVWDRVGEEGSFAMQNAILFRSFPPPDFSVPGKPLIYHYGYDAAVSGFALITRLPLDAASNAVSLLAIVWLMVIARQLAAFLGARVVGQTAAVVAAPLFGGLPYYVGIASFLKWWNWMPDCGAKGCLPWVHTNPPTGSYLFQREWPIGLPLLLTIVVLIIAASRQPPQTRRAIVRIAALSGLLLGALSIINFTSFGLSGLALGAVVAIRLTVHRSDASSSSSLACTYIAAGLIALPIAFALGGFTQLLFESPQSGFVFQMFGLAGSLPDLFTNLAISCGVTCGLAAFVFRASWPHSAFPAAMAGIGLAVPCLGYYSGSGDAAKFWVVPVVVVGLFGAVLLDSVVRKRGRLALALAATMAIGCSSSLAFFYPLDRDTYKNLMRPAGFTTAAIPPVLISEFAKRVLPSGQSVACSPELVNYCGTYGGFPELEANIITKTEGLYVGRLQQQDALEDSPPANIDALERYNVTMVIVGPDSVQWNVRVSPWLQQKRIVLLRDYSGYDLYKILPVQPRAA